MNDHPNTSPLTQYDSAKRMLHQAVRVDEVMHVRNLAERIALYGRQAKDRDIMADAMELQQRAERRLGALLIEAKAAGMLSAGGRPSGSPKRLASSPERGAEEIPANQDSQTSAEPEQVFFVFTLEEAGIDRKLSAKAQELARTEETVFEAGVARSREKILAGAAALVNPSKDISTAGKKAARAEKEIRLGQKQRALPEAKFGVVLTDDEWEHEAWSDDGLGKAAANHYPISNLDELKKRDVASLAADDCVLFMWTTVPHLARAIELMAHRGFSYKTNCIWNKIYPGARQGMGYWFRINHEILLVGTRGSVPAPAPGTQWPSVISSPVGEHSEKPDWAYALIEAYFPSLPKIELNARTAREGWARWGLEAPEGQLRAPSRDDGPPGTAAATAAHQETARMEAEQAEGAAIFAAHDFKGNGDPQGTSAPRSGETADRLGDPRGDDLVVDGEAELIPNFLGRVRS